MIVSDTKVNSLFDQMFSSCFNRAKKMNNPEPEEASSSKHQGKSTTEDREEVTSSMDNFYIEIEREMMENFKSIRKEIRMLEIRKLENFTTITRSKLTDALLDELIRNNIRCIDKLLRGYSRNHHDDISMLQLMMIFPSVGTKKIIEAIDEYVYDSNNQCKTWLQFTQATQGIDFLYIYNTLVPALMVKILMQLHDVSLEELQQRLKPIIFYPPHVTAIAAEQQQSPPPPPSSSSSSSSLLYGDTIGYDGHNENASTVRITEIPDSLKNSTDDNDDIVVDDDAKIDVEMKNNNSSNSNNNNIDIGSNFENAASAADGIRNYDEIGKGEQSILERLLSEGPSCRRRSSRKRKSILH